MPTIVTHNSEETLALGEQWGRAARPGWVIGLIGDLGAGKTHLTKGIARGLGLAARVLSPTFTLVHEHLEGRLPLYHLDLYRLNDPAQVIQAGLEPYFAQEDGVTVVEWMDRWLPGDPFEVSARASRFRRYRQVWLEAPNEQERRITYEDFGA